MRIYKISQILRGNYRPTAAAIGLFDGVHLGHQKLLQEALKLAQERNVDSAVITFYPDPAEVYRSYGKLPHLNTRQQKYEHFRAMGISRVYEIQFDPEIASLTPEDFIEYLNRLNVSELVCGFDFSFGFKGRGNSDLLVSYINRKFNVMVIDSVDHNGIKVSSTRIINALKTGNLDTANALLGYCYSIKEPECQVIPKDGIYQGKINDSEGTITVKDGVIMTDDITENNKSNLSIVFEKLI